MHKLYWYHIICILSVMWMSVAQPVNAIALISICPLASTWGRNNKVFFHRVKSSPSAVSNLDSWCWQPFPGFAKVFISCAWSHHKRQCIVPISLMSSLSPFARILRIYSMHMQNIQVWKSCMTRRRSSPLLKLDFSFHVCFSYSCFSWDDPKVNEVLFMHRCWVSMKSYSMMTSIKVSV